MATDVCVVGGGLAGMAAALRLLERGCRVTLFEASERLGGKAGATHVGGLPEEHGYHIFPVWYRNTWRLVDDLGIRSHFKDCTDFEQLRPGEYPRFRTLRNITSLRYAVGNLFSGVLSVPEMFLFYYAALDLLCEPLSDSALLDQISITGFVRSRFYRTEGVAAQFQDLMLKGISVPAHFVSAKTMQSVIAYWVKYPEPAYRVLRGDLQSQFIAPFARRLEALGCEIRLHHRLERLEVQDARITRLHFRTTADAGAGETVSRDAERVVLALPAERLAPLVDDGVYAAAPSLANARYVHARPMAALSLYLRRRLPGLPGDHINLLGSRFGLSFVDVSRLWPGHDATVLNVIASDYPALEGLSDAVAAAEIVAELRRYLPALQPADVIPERTFFQAHVEEPLFMNEVGVWHYRLQALSARQGQLDPEHKIELTNLYPAGDHCRTAIDLVCMEGAISSGLLAAEALREDAGLGEAVEVLRPERPRTALLLAAKYLLLPLALLARLVARA